MCGICGYYGRNSFHQDELKKMTAALAHRGPDADGIYSDETVGLGHKRLCILDLSALANQPMLSHDQRFLITYNGEVYNFKKIAAELKMNFSTASDTEVILEAFIKWGVDFVNKLNGMFAMAIYDKQKTELILYRDRLGIKPLFYYWNENKFAFASEIKSLLEIDTIKNSRALNDAAVNAFLHLGYIPEPLTIYKNIFKFPAGHYCRINSTTNAIEPVSFWKPEDQVKKNVATDFRSAKQTFGELIKSSVAYRLISDVPYGTFLSGGIDSSLVTAVAQQQTGNLKTFSIGFKESKYNEAGFAKSVADYLKTDHHEFMVSEDDALQLINELTSVYDEPFADSSAIPTMLVSRMAREHVKMTLSGDGGDELFLGYGAYRWAQRLNNPLINFLRKPIALSLSTMGDREKRAAHLFRYNDSERIRSHIFSQEQYFFSEDEIKNLVRPSFDISIAVSQDFSSLQRVLSAPEAQAFFDLKYYLKDDLLVKVDRASMHYGLEVRVPLLDYRIVEFALNISPELKSQNGIDKLLLKETLYDYIPKKFFERKKQGFSIPLCQWLKKDLHFLIDEYLNEAVISKFDIVNYKAVEELKLKFGKGNDYLYNRIWLLIVLHKFMIEKFS
jgi:asparagine synthase (glutamine-hydrolysing)